jgi:regulator of sigma E protease
VSFGAAILGLALLIFVHESGHFFAARAVSMRPRKFYLGFPPALIKTTRGGVEYGIGMIPLGGYVKIPGMHRPAPGDLRGTLQPAEAEAQRGGLDALDRALEHGDDAAALAALAQLRPELPGNRMLGEIEDGLAPDAYWRQPAWKRVFVIGAGPVTNIALAVVLFAAFFAAGTPQVSRTVQQVVAGDPAARAGLRAGDQVVRVSGKPVTADTISTAINATRGRPFTIVVERHGAATTIGPLRARDESGTYRVGFEISVVNGRASRSRPPSRALSG